VGVIVTKQWLASEGRAVVESLGDDPECCEFDLGPRACHDLVVGRLMPRVGQAIEHDLGLAAEA